MSTSIVWKGRLAVTPSPECGTVAARALFMVFYRDEGSVQIAHFTSCCAQHEPPDFTAFIDEAEVEQTDISDAFEQVVNDGKTRQVKRNPNPGCYIDPAQPWTWTLVNNRLATVEPIPPDEQDQFHITDAQRRLGAV